MRLAWNIAGLNNNTKKSLRLESLMLPETYAPIEARDPRRQTPEQQLTIARRLNAMFGGTVERRPSPE
jgi:hypothetical protein